MDFTDIRMTELASIIANHLAGQGIEVVLVGGLAVEIYSQNLYLTKDIDMVNTNYTPAKTLHSAMAGLGYYKQGRVYVNDSTDITVEFPPAPLFVGDELVTQTTTIKIGTGTIPILKVEDIVKDRLAAFIHWQDTQSLVQAVAVMYKHGLIPEVFQSLFNRESASQSYELLQALFDAAQQSEVTMQTLETHLAGILLQHI